MIDQKILAISNGAALLGIAVILVIFTIVAGILKDAGPPSGD